jgi:hypothetical protein
MGIIALTIFGLERKIVGRSQKARTFLGYVRQFTMAHNTGIRIFYRQFLEQSVHGSLLGFSPSIIGTTFLIETAFVANAKRATVVVVGMSTTDILWKNRDDGAIATDIIMIRGLAKASHACRNQALDAERTVAASRAAVNNQQFDCIMFKFLHTWKRFK